MCLFPSPPSQAQQSCTESMEDTSGDEREYSLLPAPINVGKYKDKGYSDVVCCSRDSSSKLSFCPPGKYLRLKRMNFQLPYDVMWLWQNNQVL